MIVVGQQRAGRAIDATDRAVNQLGTGTAEVKRGLTSIIEASRNRRLQVKNAAAANLKGRSPSIFMSSFTGDSNSETTLHPENIFLPKFTNSLRQLFSARNKQPEEPASFVASPQSASSFIKLPESSRQSHSFLPSGLSLGPAQELRERLAFTNSGTSLTFKDTKLDPSGATGTSDTAGAAIHRQILNVPNTDSHPSLILHFKFHSLVVLQHGLFRAGCEGKLHCFL